MAMADARFDGIKAALDEELVTVNKQLEEHGIPPEGGLLVEVDEGFADSAAATTERSELLALAEQLRSHREEVLAAIERIDAGTYGNCDNCGNEIPYERLEALPTARLCMSCKQIDG